ncbi:MAG: ABC transporter ATP-binding protein [Pseudomonadota bacterium]
MKAKRFSLRDTLVSYLALKEFFFENRWRLAVGFFSLLFVDFLQLLIPLVIKRAVDALTYGRATPSKLLEYGLVIIAIALLMGAFRYVWRTFLLGHSRFVEEKLRNRLYGHLQSLSFSFYQRTTTGDLMARAINDINAVRMATGMGMVALVDGMVLGIAAIGFMIYIHPLLTAFSLISAPLVILLTRVFTGRMARGHERVQKTFADLTERVREAFAGVRIIKAYAREGWQSQKVEERGEKYVSENMKLAGTVAVFLPMTAVFTNLGLAIVIALGGRLTIMGQITTGDFVAFISYLNLLAWPMMALGWVTNLVQRGAASMNRINHILDETPEIVDRPSSRADLRIRGDITLSGLSHRYPETDVHAIRDITMDIRAGQTLALVGRVGSGKTTLLQCIPNIINIPSGTLFIDGRDVRDWPLKTLRESIGFVTQEVFIFSDTIRSNVVFGRKDIPEGRLRAVLETAQIDEEVDDLEHGLDTLLGERGVTLSGGQRQRLTIARALLSDPPILILDDALSMVDTRTEERILNRVLTMRQGKTNLIVSHRISTISRADKIAVMEKGRLVETGDHEGLLKAGGLYRDLYKRQLLARELEMGFSGADKMNPDVA